MSTEAETEALLIALIDLIQEKLDAPQVIIGFVNSNGSIGVGAFIDHEGWHKIEPNFTALHDVLVADEEGANEATTIH